MKFHALLYISGCLVKIVPSHVLPDRPKRTDHQERLEQDHRIYAEVCQVPRNAVTRVSKRYLEHVHESQGRITLPYVTLPLFRPFNFSYTFPTRVYRKDSRVPPCYQGLTVPVVQLEGRLRYPRVSCTWPR